MGFYLTWNRKFQKNSKKIKKKKKNRKHQQSFISSRNRREWPRKRENIKNRSDGFLPDPE